MTRSLTGRMGADDDIREVLADVCTRNGGDFAVAYRVAAFPDHQIRCVGIVSYGAPALVQVATRLEGTPYGRLEVTVGNLPPLNRWHVRTRETLASGWLGANVWDVLGLGSQLGVLAMVEGRVWGWIGAVRMKSKPLYTSDDELAASPSARDVVQRIARADRISADIPERPGSVLVVDGKVQFSDARWPASDARLGRFLERLGEPRPGAERFGYVDGAVFAAEVLQGPTGVAWLVRAQRSQRLLATPLLELSPKQRQVAEMAARGATVAEIGRSIGATENTVKTHLRRAYEACGVATRAELLELLNATVPPDHVET